MRRRTRSPKGSGGTTDGSTTGSRGGRGRGRARGGVAGKGKPGGRGACNGGNGKTNESLAIFSADSVPKDILGISTPSSHFSRHLNGSLGNGLQLGGIPRRPATGGSANNNNNNAVNLNNGGAPPHPPGSDYYLHKKFKKVTATIDATLTSSEPVAGSSSSTNPAGSSVPSGVVYKPKFRIKSDTGGAPEEDSNHSTITINPPAEKVDQEVVNLSLKPVETPIAHQSNDNESSPLSLTPVPTNSTSILSSRIVSASSPKAITKPSSSSSKPPEPSRLNRDRLDRKSLDDRISKIIDENQSILEWPEQFTRMLKNHTSRGSSSHIPSNQRTNHLFSGGSTVEVPLTSSSFQLSNHPAGILRHHSSSSSSDGMTTCGGSVELVNSATPSPLFHQSSSSSLNSNGSVVITIGRPSSASSTSAALPADLSFGAQHHQLVHNGSSGGSVITTAIAVPSPTSSPKLATVVTSTSTTTSSMVPKKRRRLSPTPSRLCGGEVSELPVLESSGNANNGGKGYFQDLDMTVRVSNCGPSGAKVTIRSNNGAISGGSVVAPPSTHGDFNKVVEPGVSLLTRKGTDPVFFPGSGPASPLPFASSSNNKKNVRESCLSPGTSSAEHPKKSSRGRPPRKKSLEALVTAIPQNNSFEAPPSTSSSVERLVSPFPAPEGKPTMLPSPSPSMPDSRKVGSDKISESGPQSIKSENSNPAASPPIGKEEPLRNAAPLTVVPAAAPQNPKRPTFLALKPVNTNSKKTEPGVLPSPETPRVAKPYNQMTINGQAYTYLGFKVSTRSSYTCLFKTQPMFIPQETDPKLSMYTNWQPRPRDPNQIDIGISTNDSRVNGRKSPHHILYTSALGKGLDTLTVSSPDNHLPISSPVCENKTFLGELQQQGQVEDLSSSITLNEPSPPQSSLGKELIIPSAIPVTSSHLESVSDFHTSPVASSRPAQVITSSDRCSKPIMTSYTSSRPKEVRDPGSDTSSAEECSGRNRQRSSSSTERRYLHDPDDAGDVSNVSSDSPLALTTKDNRVKIMEGGFESNEDYTYVRGRGRGRYVCEACGIRCKKPSMLRKHLKTHTDLRPYTCKLCNFSFKTKGNLTKHQKSKSHHKKCAGLGIHPESSTSLAVTGPGAFSISDANTTDDNESDDDMDDDMDEGTDSQDDIDGDDDVSVTAGEDGLCEVKPETTHSSAVEGSLSFEKEIAQSLLDLSKVATLQPRTVSQGSASVVSSSDYESGREGDLRGAKKRKQFPYQDMIEDISNSSNGSCGASEMPAGGAPIDLSVKQSISPTNSHKRPKMEVSHIMEKAITVTPITKDSKKWEPPQDEDTLMGTTSKGSSSGSKTFNLTRVLNSNKGMISEDSSNQERILLKSSEMKSEVIDYPEPSTLPSQHQRILNVLPPVHLQPVQRHRTDSDTSSCGSVGGRPTTRPSEHQLPPHVVASSSSNPGGNGVKLHQPWLSPIETEESKTEQIEIAPIVEQVTVSLVPSGKTGQNKTPPSIQVKPISISPVSSGPIAQLVSSKESLTFKISEESSKDAKEVESSSMLGHAPHSQPSDSPNAKFLSGLASLKPQAEFRQPSGAQALVKDEGKAECNVCGKTFARASQLTLHMNIHYIERPFRCDPCGVSFRTKGHLIKHRRSSSHDCKVYLTEAWGVANEENPRPFKCADCKIAFRIHGHLAKHLRSKMHIMRMECLGKLPFGIFFEMEKSGINMNEIDTTDCDMSLVSLQTVARKIYGEQWRDRLTVPVEEPPT